MSRIVIKAEHLSKQYKIGAALQHHDTLRDQLADGVRRFFSRNGKRHRGPETFWALKDVSFEVSRGEVVGIIGRNGAGKSTLLKVLSRITAPTKGRVRIVGRVGSLLEVGTGFHPELTGRENIYLNGAILGMKKNEIDRKFDEIVEFSEIGQFVDTPVKRYSSGMYVRLAFSVAAHLETEVLIVDEVLAVGDVRFQGKCLEKIKDVRREGRTILFVSHNMETVSRLCDRMLLIKEGSVLLEGTPREVVSAYLNMEHGRTGQREWNDRDTAPGGKVARLCGVRLRDENGKVFESIDIRSPFSIEMEYDVLEPGYVLVPNFHFFNEMNVHIFSVLDNDPSWRQRQRPTGRYTSAVHIPGNFLSDGTHTITMELTSLAPVIEDLYTVRDALGFKVIDSPGDGSARGSWTGPMDGVIRPLLEWNTRFTSSELPSGCD